MRLFPGFKVRRVKTSGAAIHLRVGGEGPPVLLLHGYPETHVMWHKVAPALARDYTVVCPDSRGYGDSSKPKGLPDHSNYSRRALAKDMAEVMTALGHERFHVVGHDRGGRLAHRLARDHGRRVATLAVLDISPTLKVFQSTDQALATAFYHWFFLIQKSPLPENMINPVRKEYLLRRIGRGAVGLKVFPDAVIREYLRGFDARGVHASCEDYRAAASIDLVHDRKDLKKKLAMPVLALWAKQSPVGTQFDCLADWREVAKDVRGRALPCGHFLPEEKPAEVLRELRRHLKRATA
jgi:haloacetate dehalogenase